MGRFNKFKTIIQEIKKYHLILWICVSLISTVPLGLLFLSASSTVEDTILILAVKGIMHIAFTFVLVQPIFLGAGIFFSTKEARHAFIKPLNDKTDFRRFFLQYIIYVVFVTIYTIAFCCGVLLIAAILAGPNAAFILMLFPGVTVAAIITTLFLSSIATFFAMLFDDVKLTSIMGAIFYFVIAHVTGYPIYSLTFREIAVLGPVYYFLGLAIVLSGVSFGSPENMADYFGMYFISGALIIPTVIFTLEFALAILGAAQVFTYNRERWFLEKTEKFATDETFFDIKPEQIKRLDSLKHGLKIRRGMTAAVLIVIMLIVPTAVTNYTMDRRNEYHTLVYESSPQGENLEIGQWFNKSFVALGPPDFSKWLHCYCYAHVLAWDNYSEIKIEYYLLAITLGEFQQLNTTEIIERGETDSEILTKSNEIDITAFRLSYGLDYVLTLRFLDPEDNEMVGNLRVSIVIEIEAW